MGSPTLRTVFRKETKSSFMQFLSHNAQYETGTPARAEISCSVEVPVPTAYLYRIVSLFHIKNGTEYRSHVRFTYFFA